MNKPATIPEKFFEDLLHKKYLLTDSRKLQLSNESVFFAIKGKKHDGHIYISDLYEKGIRDFVVEDVPEQSLYPDANFYQVENVVEALQQLVALHREQYKFPVVAITGSNGKTIVKEWLYQLLSPDFAIIKSPGSYNSQIGVPLSVWGIEDRHQLGIFEAGISTTNEMEKLEKVIQPNVGILTNIGSSHDEGFSSREEKVKEKLKLFKNVDLLIYPKNIEVSSNLLSTIKAQKVNWAFGEDADFRFDVSQEPGQKTKVICFYNSDKLELETNFADAASLQNLASCITFILSFFNDKSNITDRIKEGVKALRGVRMRLELKKGNNECLLIDDTYNNDLAGLSVALDFLEQQSHANKKTVILSDMLESGEESATLYQKVNELLQQNAVSKFIGVGSEISLHKNVFTLAETAFYEDTKDFLADKKQLGNFSKEVVLVKGARKFLFEEVVNALQEKIHGTHLEINLEAVTNNLNFYKSLLKPQTKLMVMVKAFGYGSSGFEIAKLLQHHRVDYLAVAYTDEAVRLRENGITLPVMVMNPHPESFEKLYQHDLEPQIYSLEILYHLIDFLQQKETGKKMNVHINFDTGMRRLGFEVDEVKDLVTSLKQHGGKIHVKAVMTHLAGADEKEHNAFTLRQLESFEKVCNNMENELGYAFIKHALNSAGIARFNDRQFDMVRLGIGLYGVEPNAFYQDKLQAVSTLKTSISQVKKVKKGESIGYSRKGMAIEDMEIATIAIGYADGYDRRFGNGVGKVLVKGKLAPVTGSVCMDMTMIDVTGLNVKAGEEVVIFGESPTVVELANWVGTIPYEIMTNVNERVKRLYFNG
ncbi:MAG: bifunctional UDP-N-acetylmuramoyl-tripeptide:D-alanyl-D-alanine ligase/alanine racemase [Thalassobius sp.]|nr:bifunctional UDP-N-acetylmuramoyl-tripeptide:D-alanyl-D-alanine ligase/alanine racemase [Thalassovita sp.]